MPIEFRCTQCDKLLRTGDETAGKQAKCPQCGTVLAIPSLGTPPPPPAGVTPQPPPGASPFGSVGTPPPETGAPENPYRSPSADYSGAQTQPFAQHGTIVPTRIDFSDMFSRTWTILTSNANVWLMCLAVLIVSFIISFCFNFVFGMVTNILAAATKDHTVVIVASFIQQIITTCFSLWLTAGQMIFFLKTARGQNPSIGDLFLGGPYILNILGGTILLGLINVAIAVLPVGIGAGVAFAIGANPAIGAAIGVLLIIVPIIIVALMFAQFMYLIVDQNLGPIEALRASAQITSGNKLTMLAIGVASALLSLVALIPCGLGLLLAVPYFALMGAVAYLAMSGQRTAEQLISNQPFVPQYPPPQPPEEYPPSQPPV